MPHARRRRSSGEHEEGTWQDALLCSAARFLKTRTRMEPVTREGQDRHLAAAEAAGGGRIDYAWVTIVLSWGLGMDPIKVGEAYDDGRNTHGSGLLSAREVIRFTFGTIHVGQGARWSGLDDCA